MLEAAPRQLASVVMLSRNIKSGDYLGFDISRIWMNIDVFSLCDIMTNHL